MELATVGRKANLRPKGVRREEGVFEYLSNDATVQVIV